MGWMLVAELHTPCVNLLSLICVAEVLHTCCYVAKCVAHDNMVQQCNFPTVMIVALPTVCKVHIREL